MFFGAHPLIMPNHRKLFRLYLETKCSNPLPVCIGAVQVKASPEVEDWSKN